MRNTQWTAVLVLAVMVGGITFVSVYLGGREKTIEVQPSSLNFPVNAYPRDGEKNIVTEVRQTGSQDFWFINETGQDTAVGLTEKGCTCTEVEIALAPANWPTPRFWSVLVTRLLQLPPRGLVNVTSLAAAYEREQQLSEWSGEAKTMILTKENSIPVPAGAIGRVRLTWRQETSRPLQTNAELWVGERGGSVTARLDVSIRVAEALEYRKDVFMPAVNNRDLEQRESEPTWIKCWSLTRRSFPLKAELIDQRMKKESDAVEVGEPVPLNDAEIRQLARQLAEERRDALLIVLSGYKIPVRLKAKAKDGTPIDWGNFGRYVRLSSTDEGIDPVVVHVLGEVVGDVVVSGGKAQGVIDLGPFPYKRGAQGDIPLHTDEKDLELEVDRDRLPAYLRARLSQPVATGGHRSWRLHVEVPPGAALGEFPNADNPAYRDSAIYVKTKQKQPRCIRVPVVGTANQG